MGDEEVPLNKEEQARLEKLLAETALVNEQLTNAKRENATLSARYWFVPNPGQIFQTVVAGFLLFGAIFFLYQPTIETVKEVERRAATLAKLDAAIQQKKNDQLSLENQETKAALKRQGQQLKVQEERYGAELKKLAENLKQNKKEKEEAVRLVKNLRQQLTKISVEYRAFAKTSEAEKGKYILLAKQTEARASKLTDQLQALEEQARAAEKQATQVRKQVETLPFRNSIGMEFVYIPAGKFMMGLTEGRTNERPVHQVTISQPFYLGRYEVTQGQWEAVMESNPSEFKGDPNRPVEEVSWDDAQEFIQQLNAREPDQQYRLPTEAEC